MKRAELLRHLERNGCALLREGAKHTVYHNPKVQRTATVPRHKEIKAPTAERICKDLGVPGP